MSLGDIGILIAVATLAFLLAGAMAPFEALGWWAGWYGRRLEPPHPRPTKHREPPAAHRFVIFLSGVHSVSGRAFAKREKEFLLRLRRRLPGVIFLQVFPYSVTNRPLTGQRLFAWFWRWALRMKRTRMAVIGLLINLRNAWQVAVSADRRYGPIYNQGSAELLLSALEQAGYQPDSGLPVTLIGYSGGGQVAVGAASHLKEILKVPVTVIALGGVLSSDPGLLQLDRLYFLYGDRDEVQRLAGLLFPGRWPLLPYSTWNQARAQGNIEFIQLGPMTHTGKGVYLDAETLLPDGFSYLERTVEVVAELIHRGAPQPSPRKTASQQAPGS